MIFEQISARGDRNFGYLIADPDAKLAAVIDPSGAPQKFSERLAGLNLKLVWILCTHHHRDHVDGVAQLKTKFDAPVAMQADSPQASDVRLSDGQLIEIGSVRLRTIHTPGHTDDSVCFYTSGYVVTGDTLFVGKVGGTTDKANARKEYDSLHEKLEVLPEDTEVYPGHDYGVRPVSTIGDEKRENPFLLQPDFEHFFDLKQNWAAYKQAHGIP